MTKSGGGKMGATRRAGRSRGDPEKQGEAGATGGEDDVARLAAEAERLREQLAIEQERTKKLETANTTVAARLNKAIATIRQLLERQG
jgi:Domain of unknown function (DUF4164)